jgi:hypothetical protein
VLYVFGFERIAVALGDLYFVDPNPAPGQEGAERGVRIELRRVEPGELEGSIYSARPIAVREPLWRVDLLETADGPVGSFDRTHHHPRFRGWEPGHRVFVPELSDDPTGWFEARLRDIDPVLAEAGVEGSELGPRDREDLRDAAAEIVACLRNLLARVHDGRLAVAPQDDLEAARLSWL